MSFICFQRADALHEHEKKLRAIEVTDAGSLCTYLAEYFKFIYNHKMFGCVYDIYTDYAKVHRENGQVIDGIPAIEHDVMKLCTSFPDLTINIPDIFAVPNGENAYKVWMRHYFIGTNTGYSQYGPPTGIQMTEDQALSLSAFYVEKIEDEWLIVDEYTGRPSDYLRYACTGDPSFSSSLKV